MPTCEELVDKMLDMAKVTNQDYLIDLGSGDGRFVITAAKRGARALGIEYNPDLVALSKRSAAKQGVSDKARFIEADIFKSDFSQATVICLFLLDELNLRLRPKILALKPGTRIVTNTFTMGDWNPDQIENAENVQCEGFARSYLFIVPAKVEGTWRLGEGELTLSQSFQMFSGTLKTGTKETPVAGRLKGDLISFSAGDVKYTGRVDGKSMEGTVESGGTAARWSAARAR